jgi:hypothetical protein
MLEQGRWQAILDVPEGGTDGYFILENENAAALWPARAPKGTFRISGE